MDFRSHVCLYVLRKKEVRGHVDAHREGRINVLKTTGREKRPQAFQSITHSRR